MSDETQVPGSIAVPAQPETLGTLSVEEVGTADGEPAVFIHGMMSSNLQWQVNLAGLSQHLRMFLVELPGHGGSPAPDDVRAYGPSVVLPAINAIREAAGVSSWWVIGQSLGAAVAMHHVLSDQAAARGLIFTNSRAAFGISRTASLVVPDTVEERRELRFHPSNAKRFPAELRQQMSAAADGIEPHVLRHVAQNAPEWSARESLGSLGVPTLLVTGMWEKAFQPFVQVARDEITDIEIVELEGGHSINIERPLEFESAVLSFIANTEGDNQEIHRD